jgi:hypothetical protein
MSNRAIKNFSVIYLVTLVLGFAVIISEYFIRF